MGYFPVRYDSRVVIYERKMFIRLATDLFQALKCSIILLVLLDGPFLDPFRLFLVFF